jgi:hypothetical protein
LHKAHKTVHAPRKVIRSPRKAILKTRKAVHAPRKVVGRLPVHEKPGDFAVPGRRTKPYKEVGGLAGVYFGFLNSMPLIWRNSGPVAPKTAFTYFLTIQKITE